MNYRDTPCNKIIILMIFILLSQNLNAQSDQTKLFLSPQFGLSQFKFEPLWRTISPYYDYKTNTYVGVDLSLEKKVFSNWSYLLSIGLIKNGMEGRMFKKTMIINPPIEYRKEIWSTFNIYNIRGSCDIEYNLANIISLGAGIKYVRELRVFETQQEVWLSDFYGEDKFFSKTPRQVYSDFRKNNFYSSIYIKHFFSQKVSINLVVNAGLNSITTFEQNYFMRPIEYYFTLNFYL